MSRKKEEAKKILDGARKGLIELPDEEKFLISSDSKVKRKKGMAPAVDDKLALKGFSLVEQVRAKKPVDLLRRNLKYIKYTDSRPLDPNKSQKMLNFHMRKLTDKTLIRKHRESLTGLREPKKVKNKKGSVFSEKDFKNLTSNQKKKKQNSDGCFV